MTGWGRAGWRLPGLAVATLVAMVACSTGTPAPDGVAGGATTAAPLPAAVTLPPVPSGRPAAGLVGAVGSDPGAMRSLGTVPVDIGASAEASAWLGRRVAVVSGDQAGAPEVVIVDPVARHVLARHQLAGVVSAVGHLPDGLVVLLTPYRAIGPARLAVVGRQGTVRTVTLGRVAAGFRPPKVEGPDAVAHQREAGLAVDPAGRRAFVVAPWRQARWVGGGLLAVVAGELRVAHDAKGEPVQRAHVAGVELVHTARWRAYGLHAGASRADYQGGRLLLSGGTWGGDATSSIPRGVGLTVYGPGTAARCTCSAASSSTR